MSIDKRGKNTFRFRIMFKGNNYTMTYYGSEKEAKRAHDEFVLDVKKGKFLQASTMTIRELWELYIESKDLQWSTVRLHRCHMKSFDFLDMQAAELTKVFLKKYHNSNQRFGNDDNFRSLKAVLNFGVEMDIINENPLNFKLRRKAKPKFQEILTMEQLKILFKGILAMENKEYQVFFLTQLCLGTRYGETAGLTKNDIDTTNHIATIRHQLKNNGNGYELGKLKTEYSSRDIYIVDVLRPYLYELVFRTKPNELIFKNNGEHFWINLVNKKLAELCKSLDIPAITSHKLRKLSATLSVYAGVDPLSVSKRLGHASLDMTEHYLLSMTEKKKEEAEKMNLFLQNMS